MRSRICDLTHYVVNTRPGETDYFQPGSNTKRKVQYHINILIEKEGVSPADLEKVLERLLKIKDSY